MSREPQVPEGIVILDTNIVLDLFLFQDPRTAVLREQLQSKRLSWLATAHMRNELERVLTYAHISAKLSYYEKTPADILAAFDQAVQIYEQPTAKAPYVCKDPDDQAFIDLAAQLAGQAPGQKVTLISKDKAVTSMRKRLEKLSVFVTTTLLA
ncbi:putative toxin-antitoxin system toxin component, PIN family [Variovorax sp. PCZ-1]|uniref:putative toxin-antitoxin system toxin component, PIN family n=1 Tax=Variovorax sp. PCZ-1 TaxID=2835533 RepID=UPI001BCBB845|nr:putative toxin-antitoxin system toxin component, PIN family [Variovorax sp. PCZ-1]MBS7806051.1 putative toxin-antitoxin system toxin component, PIN family [Variovorax sp. PCZ-1]